MRTQVVILGGGPAGLLLAHLLHAAGVDTIVVETRSRAYVEDRVRAGVLEYHTAELLDAVGVGARMRQVGLVHRGIELQFGPVRRRIDFEELTGKHVVVYGQQEVVKDLIAARLAARLDLRFEATVRRIDLGGDGPATVEVENADGKRWTIEADYVAGCDGFHGPSRTAIPVTERVIYEHVFPFAWLGILAETPPATDELIYANHDAGFALVSMRSRTVSRFYLQCAPDEDLQQWSDERIWTELRRRLTSDDGGEAVIAGPIVQKSVTPMRSFVCAPMRYRQLFLAGDSAHIVPPTGAKGMNLAVADVRVLARALATFYATGSTAGLDAYSDTCLQRIWKTQRFSTAMTRLLHRFERDSPFEREVQRAEFDYVTTSRAAATSLAENYVGLRFYEPSHALT